MAKMVVLGGGMVGSAMAFDLHRNGHEVTLVDRSEAALAVAEQRWGVAVRQADLADSDAIRAAAEPADVVLGALPSVLGRRALEVLVTMGRPVVDISFLTEDPRDLDDAARAAGVPVVYDCGVAPGMSNLLCGRAAAGLSDCQRLSIRVGGLPVQRHLPFEYKAPFSPYDVLEEYMRPSRVVEHGRIVVKEALSEVEHVHIEGLGTLEAFNTDGLRSLVDLPVPHMIEKTMRYPGHVALMKAFRHIGLFDLEPVDIDGVRISPRRFTSQLLFPKWQFEDGEADLTVMTVEGWGTRDGAPTHWRWELFDRYDPETNVRSMSRTTGYTATVMAEQVLAGAVAPGVHAPESLGADAAFTEAMLEGLASRGVHYRFREEQG